LRSSIGHVRVFVHGLDRTAFGAEMGTVG
jgi:hypothetical protein